MKLLERGVSGGYNFASDQSEWVQCEMIKNNALSRIPVGTDRAMMTFVINVLTVNVLWCNLTSAKMGKCCSKKCHHCDCGSEYDPHKGLDEGGMCHKASGFIL